MSISPPNPDGIQQRDEFEGSRLSWPLPSIGRARYVFAAFFAFGTAAWGAGILAAAVRFVSSPTIDLVIWIAGWTVCGSWLPLLFWAFLRPRPESVLLADSYLTYDPGWDMMSPVYLARMQSGTQSVFPNMPMTVPKDQIELDGGRLFLQNGGKRVEIGEFLSEADRHSLFTVLENWRG